MSLVFKKIESGDIFTRDFSPLARNNEIVFPQSEEIAVVYGPNGTGKTRDELPLSTGEQNFLSLTFEFLKAKNSERPIVVIDDPVSSFDSIYKNKVVYAIVKMLHHKKRIVLTHNTDLIRLLDGQYRRCFPC